MTREEQLLMYQTVAARRVSYESMFWQVPSLSLTAQAFLMTIGFTPGSGRLARIASGLLAVAITLMALQTLLRNRRHELADSVWLARMEQSLGWEQLHASADERCRRLGVPTPRFARVKSLHVWFYGLTTFGLAGLGLAIDGLVG